MTEDERDRIHDAAHELGHALVGRDLGRTVRLVVTTPGRAFTDLEPASDTPLADETVIHMAGAIAGKYVDLARVHSPPPIDHEAAIAAGIARLPSSDREFVAYNVRTDWRSAGCTSDAQKVAAAALRVPEPERDAFLADCSNRSLLLVFEQLPLIEALVPLALRNPILTGDELEAGIAALMGQGETRA